MIGLTNIVNVAAHLGHFLDRIYCSDSTYVSTKAIKATVCTKHSAVIASAGSDCIIDYNKSRTLTSFRKHTPGQMSRFLTDSSYIDWSLVFSATDLQLSFDLFYKQILCMLNLHFPVSTVTLTSRDPPYVTPRIKSILRARNRHMHAGKLELAAACSEQVASLIAKANENRLVGLSGKTAPRTLWSEVNIALNRGKPSIINRSGTSLDSSVFNAHYASVSADAHYTAPSPKHTCALPEELFDEMSVFWLLEHIKDTSAGPDGLPAWFLRLAAPVIARPLAWL